MGHTVVVAGVGRTVGAAVARRFAAEGCRVGLFARSSGFIEELTAELRGEGAEALAVPTDVTDPEAVAAGFEAVRDALGPVDVLVLNASAPGGAGPLDTDPADFERTWRVRVRGSLLCVQAAVPDMLDASDATDGAVETTTDGADDTTGGRSDGTTAGGNDAAGAGGTVIFSGTSFAERGAPEQVAWGAASAGARGLARSLADALPIHVAYVAIDGAVAPPESTWAGAIPADAVADTYCSISDQ
jgi:NAD(P)-dependent dehydrogenase (short-subunit alcohol dehydrogenase family)